MENTKKSFKDKWEKNPDLVFSETLKPGSDIFSWIVKRNGLGDAEGLALFLKKSRRILDAGCGNGRLTALLREYSSPEQTEIIGIDLVSAQIARKNLAHYRNVTIYEKDLLGDLRDLGEFDFIYCQEVLHHTVAPEKAFQNLCNRLAAGGEIAIYVYKTKTPAREFVDDYVREKISALPYDEAMKVCDQITELGRALSRYQLKIAVPAVDILDIEKGEYDLQRFIYHFFMKCFWNPELSFQENAVINYDWYHPQTCSRHTVEEVRGWFMNAGLNLFFQSRYSNHEKLIQV